VGRSIGTLDVVRPRTPSIYEPYRGAGGTVGIAPDMQFEARTEASDPGELPADHESVNRRPPGIRSLSGADAHASVSRNPLLLASSPARVDTTPAGRRVDRVPSPHDKAPIPSQTVAPSPSLPLPKTLEPVSEPSSLEPSESHLPALVAQQRPGQPSVSQIGEPDQAVSSAPTLEGQGHPSVAAKQIQHRPRPEPRKLDGSGPQAITTESETNPLLPHLIREGAVPETGSLIPSRAPGSRESRVAPESDQVPAAAAQFTVLPYDPQRIPEPESEPFLGAAERHSLSPNAEAVAPLEPISGSLSVPTGVPVIRAPRTPRSEPADVTGQESPSNPSILVTIGRVEVRAMLPAPRERRPPTQRSRPTVSLDDYLKRPRGQP